MKSKKILMGILLLSLVFGTILTGCKEPEPDEPRYTVWTDTITYSEYSSTFGTLNDGYYIRYELTSSGWNTIASSLTDEGKHNWTEGDIKNWFIGRGFGDTEANNAKAWLITTSHGFIASRSGTIVYMILK